MVKNLPDSLKPFQEALEQAKAIQIEHFAFAEQGRFFDYCLICSGQSRAHVRGIAEKVEQELKKSALAPLGVEGLNDLNWVLLDYETVLVHVFLEEVRHLYNLEEIYSVWEKAPKKLVELDVSV